MGIAERKEREKQQRKLDIINAAERVFFSKGYSSTTMEEIAQEAELSRGTLYLYFKGKDEVHREIVANGIDILFDLVQSGIAGESNGMANLAVIWECFVRFSKEYGDYFDAFIHYESKEVDLESREEVEKWLNRYKLIDFIIKTISQGMADGSIRQDMDPTVLTLLFWTQVTGAIQFIRFKKALVKNLLKIEPDEFLEYVRELVFSHLSPQ